jgi:16S rRNA (guanine966-N2)-methyltransferase
MRIIGGEARGRRLYIPGTAAVRPTAERIKGAFFNRGALKAVFVENNRPLTEAIGRNIETCGFGDKSEILASDFIKAIQRLVKRSEAFDILFADPPYERGIVSLTLEHLRNGSLMEKDGLLAVQHSVREVATVDESGQLVLTDRRQYGDTILSFFKKRCR